MTSISWLHLTDFHIGAPDQKWIISHNAKHVFFEDIKHTCKEYGPWDLVLFTGDLTYSGSEQEFNKFQQFLSELWELLKNEGPTPYLLAVPGNHDLLRPDISDKEKVEKLEEWHTSKSLRKDFWKQGSELHNFIETRFKEYTSWWDDPTTHRPQNVNKGKLPGDFSCTFQKDDVKLGILGLNTSFLQLTNADYENQLVIDDEQIQAICPEGLPTWSNNHHACLILTHHPPAWLSQNSKELLDSFITTRGQFAVHLCGHLHEAYLVSTEESGASARRRWQGRALFGTEEIEGTKIKRLHGYTVGQIKFKKNQEGELIFCPREARTQGKETRMVPDYSSVLIDNFPPIKKPIIIDLLKSYTPPEEPAESDDQKQALIKDCRTLSQKILERHQQFKEWKELHNKLQTNCERLNRFQEGVTGAIHKPDYVHVFQLSQGSEMRYRIEENQDFIQTIRNAKTEGVRKEIKQQNFKDKIRETESDIDAINELVNDWGKQEYKKTLSEDEAKSLQSSLISLGIKNGALLTMIDKRMQDQITESQEEVETLHRKISKLCTLEEIS